jgi:hypothetical protein
MRAKMIGRLALGALLFAASATAQQLPDFHVDIPDIQIEIPDVHVDIPDVHVNVDPQLSELHTQLREQTKQLLEQLQKQLGTQSQQFQDQRFRLASRSNCNGPEQTEKFSRTVRLARDGSVTIGNVSGDIVVTTRAGDDLSIDAVKRTRCEASQLAGVEIVIEDRAGRVDVKTEYPLKGNGGVSVDYIISVPSWAPIELHSVSGGVRVTGVQGATRAETVSGTIVIANTPRVELAKSVSGDVELVGTTEAGDLNAGTVSGDVRARGIKARYLNINTVSGSVTLSDASADRLAIRSMSGDVSYTGSLNKGGRYELTTHSGDLRLAVGSGVGFELDANTFSGSIHTDIPLTLTGTITGSVRSRGPRGSITHATFGDGSAALSLRTFSGDVMITK